GPDVRARPRAGRLGGRDGDLQAAEAQPDLDRVLPDPREPHRGPFGGPLSVLCGARGAPGGPPRPAGGRVAPEEMLAASGAGVLRAGQGAGLKYWALASRVVPDPL